LLKQQEVELARKELLAKEKEFKQKLEEQEKKFRLEEKNIEAMKQKKQVLGKMTHDIKPAINEANEIAKQLNQNVTFSFSLISAGTSESLSGEKVDNLLKARKE
jgi:hypothetical protein